MVAPYSPSEGIQSPVPPAVQIQQQKQQATKSQSGTQPPEKKSDETKRPLNLKNRASEPGALKRIFGYDPDICDSDAIANTVLFIGMGVLALFLLDLIVGVAKNVGAKAAAKKSGKAGGGGASLELQSVAGAATSAAPPVNLVPLLYVPASAAVGAVTN